MKVLVYIAFLLLPSLSEACLCNGITAATCATAPCTIKCGLCQEHCCSFPFGREDLNEDTERLLLPCLGREEDNSAASAENIDPVIDTIEKESFDVCDMDGDAGLSWEEVTACIERFGAFFQDLDFPTEEVTACIERFGAFFQDLDFP